MVFWFGDRVLVSLIAIQFLVPLDYYIRSSHIDPYNECGTWRMFSTIGYSPSRNYWLRITQEDPDGIPITRLEVARLGVPTMWVDRIFATGNRGAGPTPLAVLDRIGSRLCNLLPNTTAAVAVTRVIAPFDESEIDEGETRVIMCIR